MKTTGQNPQTVIIPSPLLLFILVMVEVIEALIEEGEEA
jgi:hypothetical protein